MASGDIGTEVSRGEYDYNYAGMRIRHLGSERGDIEYIYDDQSIVDEVLNSSTTQVAHYRYGDRLLSLATDAGEQFYHYASLGTTANLSNSSGENQIAYRVDPFGDITHQEGESENRQVFTGQEHDEQTGLIYFGARFYDPDSARFINQDSYLGESNTPPSLHRYLYAYGNPTYYVDLFGYNSTCFSDNGSCGADEGYQPTKDRMQGNEPKDYSEADKAHTERNKQSSTEGVAHWRRHCESHDCNKEDESSQLTTESNSLNKPNQRTLSPSEERLKDIFSPDGFVDQEALDNLRRAKEEGNWKDIAYWSGVLLVRSTKQGQLAEDAKDFVEDPSFDNLPGGKKKKKNKKRQGRQYHTKYDVVLDQNQYFHSDAKQFRYANKKLIKKLKSDPGFRKKMFKKNPKLKRWMKDSTKHSSSPPGLTWHHDEKPGVLKLVHRGDHNKQHKIYHPEGSGGRDIWGGGKPGREGKLNEDGTLK